MSISAVKSIQSQYAAQPIQPRRKQESSARADRNAGPDTVSLSPEALALAKTARVEAGVPALPVSGSPVSGEALALPEWLAGGPSPEASGSAAALNGPLAPDAPGSAFGKILQREILKAIGGGRSGMGTLFGGQSGAGASSGGQSPAKGLSLGA